MRRMTVIAALLALAACGDGNRMDRKAEPAKPAPNAVPPRGNPGIIGAMDQVPVAQRGQFQRALSCEVKSNAKAGKPALEVTPEFLTSLRERLAKNPKLATC